MAKGKSLESLYITLGLDVSQLTSDFIAADKTVAENMAKINRENNLLKLRMQVDTGNLDPVKDAAQILAIKTQILNEQLAMQKDRAKMASAAWTEVSKKLGYTATQTQKAEAAMLREKFAVQGLEREIKQLNQTQQQSPTSNKANSILTMYQSLKGGVTGAVGGVTNALGQLQNATASTDTALTKVASALSALKHPAVIATAAIAALPVVAIAAEKELVSLAKPAIAAGDSVYILAKRMGTTASEAVKFSSACKLMDTDVNMVLTSLQRMDKQWLTAGANGNTVTNALKAVGVSLTDSNGKLKSYNDQMIALSEGFQRAKAAGQELQLGTLLFRNGLGDMVVAIEDYQGALKYLDENIVRNGLADPNLAHEMKQELMALDILNGQISASFSQALMPVAKELAPELIKQLGEMVKIIRENSDTIKYFGEVAGGVLSGLAGLATDLVKLFAAVGKGFREITEDKQTAEMDLVVKDDSIKTLEDFKKYKEKIGTDFFSLNPNTMRTDAMEKTAEAFYRMQWKKILQARAKAKDEADKKKAEQDKQSKGESLFKSEEETKSEENIAKYQKEIEDIKYKATHTTVENQIHDINRWKEEQLKAVADTKNAEEERAKIVELAEAKIQEAKRKSNEESAKRTQDYLKEANQISSEKTMSAYEKEIAKIEEWKAKAKEKADTVDDLGKKAEEVAAIEINAAAKAAKAYEDEVERIKNATKSFQDEIYELTHSQYENDMKKIFEKYQKGLKDGVDQNTMDTWYRLNAAKLNENARTKKDYTRPGQFAAPNYELPDYMSQARQALDVASKSYIDDSSKLEQGWREYSAGVGKVLEFTGKMTDSSEQFTNASKNMESVYTRLSAVNGKMAAYDIDGKLAEGWTQYSGNIGKVLTFTGKMANATEKLTAASQTMQSAYTRLGGIKNPVYDIDGNLMKNAYYTQMEDGFSKIYTFTDELSTASQSLQDAAQSMADVAQNQYVSSNEQPTIQPNNNISVNVNIGNAVTPDSEAISWLADTVSDKITPVVTQAIGNMDNSYYGV